MNDTDTGRLSILHDLKGFQVRKGEPDIRGWDVVTSDKKKIGEVHELIVDTVDLKVRYLDIDVDSKVLDTKKNSHVLIPIAGAHLDDDDNRVYLEEISLQELLALPPYDHRRITREYESNIASWFQKASRRDTENSLPPVSSTTTPSASTTRATDAVTPSSGTDDFYNQEHFADRGFWGKRRAGREADPYLDRSSDEVPETAERDSRLTEKDPESRTRLP